MRILMASHGYPPTVSGVTLVVQKVARAMVQRGHEVTVITASEHGDPYRDQDEGVQLIRISAAFNPFWKEAPIPFIGQTHPRILFVSRLAKDKEIDVLIQAMPILWAQHRAHLLLVGRGDDRQRLEAMTLDLGLDHCVHFLGFVPEEELPSIYRLSDLFAIASICEVQSLPTLQGAATGLPLVATDAVALPELVHDGVNGFLVEPGQPQALAEAASQILGDPELAAKMGQASLPIAQEHAETRTFDHYEGLYHETVLATAGRRKPASARAVP